MQKSCNWSIYVILGLFWTPPQLLNFPKPKRPVFGEREHRSKFEVRLTILFPDFPNFIISYRNKHPYIAMPLALGDAFADNEKLDALSASAENGIGINGTVANKELKAPIVIEEEEEEETDRSCGQRILDVMIAQYFVVGLISFIALAAIYPDLGRNRILNDADHVNCLIVLFV